MCMQTILVYHKRKFNKYLKKATNQITLTLSTREALTGKMCHFASCQPTMCHRESFQCFNGYALIKSGNFSDYIYFKSNNLKRQSCSRETVCMQTILVYHKRKFNNYLKKATNQISLTLSTREALTGKMCHFASCQPTMCHRESFQCFNGYALIKSGNFSDYIYFKSNNLKRQSCSRETVCMQTILVYHKRKFNNYLKKATNQISLTLSTREALTGKMCHFASCQPTMCHRESFQCFNGYALIKSGNFSDYIYFKSNNLKRQSCSRETVCMQTILVYHKRKFNNYLKKATNQISLTLSTSEALTGKMCHFASCQPTMCHRESFQCFNGYALIKW